MSQIRISSRYNGPPNMANGGILAGTMASALGIDVELTLRNPAPLETDMELIRDETGARLMHGDKLIASAREDTVDLKAPEAPDFKEATNASKNYLGFREHPFPTCFVCGTKRHAPDGLCLYPGPISEEQIAAPFVPNKEFDAGNGEVRKEIIWAALDCPSGIVLMKDRFTPVVTGRMTARLKKSIYVDGRYVVIGWVNEHDGRKHATGSAIYNEDGELCAVAKALWFDV